MVMKWCSSMPARRLVHPRLLPWFLQFQSAAMIRSPPAVGSELAGQGQPASRRSQALPCRSHNLHSKWHTLVSDQYCNGNNCRYPLIQRNNSLIISLQVSSMHWLSHFRVHRCERHHLTTKSHLYPAKSKPLHQSRPVCTLPTRALGFIYLVLLTT